MKIKTIDALKILCLVTVIFSYFYGYLTRENLAGGAESDFISFTWPIIQSFKNDFFYTIKNYGNFGEGSWPMFHIINAFLNPLSNSQIYFQFSITILSFVNFFIFGKIIKEKYNLKILDSFLFASIILLLPLYRASAYWGTTENLGWLFLLLAIQFYIKLENINKNINTKILINIFFVCLFSSLALYTRQYLIFFTIFFILDLLLIKKNFNLLYISLLFFAIFSVPGFLLIDFWGGLYDVANFPADLPQDYHNPKFILRNLPFLFSFFSFYLMPFLIIQIMNSNFNIILKRHYLSFLSYFIFLLILFSFGFFDFLETLKYGGGAFLKIDYFLFDRKLIFFILMSSLGFSLFYEIVKQNYKVNILLSFSLLIFCFPKIILQEYYEPLILILFFLLFNHKINYLFLKQNNKGIFIFLFYYLFYWGSAIYYRNYLLL